MTVRLAVLALISILILAGLFLILRPDQPMAAPTQRSFDLEVQGSGMSPDEVSVGEGDSVILNVTSDRPVEIHVHGYDLERKIEPGETTNLSFEADKTGRFPVEDHETEENIGALIVEPR